MKRADRSEPTRTCTRGAQTCPASRMPADGVGRPRPKAPDVELQLFTFSLCFSMFPTPSSGKMFTFEHTHTHTHIHTHGIQRALASVLRGRAWGVGRRDPETETRGERGGRRSRSPSAPQPSLPSSSSFSFSSPRKQVLGVGGGTRHCCCPKAL